MMLIYSAPQRQAVFQNVAKAPELIGSIVTMVGHLGTQYVLTDFSEHSLTIMAANGRERQVPHCAVWELHTPEGKIYRARNLSHA